MKAQNKTSLGFNLALLDADEGTITKRLAAYYSGIEYVDLLSIELVTKVLNFATREQAESLCILPIKKTNKNIVLAVANPIHPKLSSFIKELKMLKNIDVEIVMTPESYISYIKLAIDQAIPKEQKSMIKEQLDAEATEGRVTIYELYQSPTLKMCTCMTTFDKVLFVSAR